MSFQWPLALIGLVVVPLAAALYARRERRRDAAAARFGNPALLPNLVRESPGWRRHVALGVLLAALTLMLVGVARPHAKVRVARREATILLALDTSISMRATDVKPTRLAAARAAAASFVRAVPDRFRIGVVGFNARPFIAVAPTQDRGLVLGALRSLRPGEGTAVGDAVALSLHLAERQRTPDGTKPPAAILLISDGAQKSGKTTLDAAARRAREQHVPVYAIVVGTDVGVINVRLTGGYHQQIRVPPDPTALARLAEATDGELFTATDDKRLRRVYELLGSRLGHRRQDREMTDFFAGGSAALLLVGGALSAFWFRRLP